MKKNLTLFLLVFSMLGARAGWEIFWCDYVDNHGKCIGRADQYEWNGDRLTLSLVVNNKNKLTTTKLLYKVYFQKNEEKDDKDDIYAELSLYVKPDWYSGIKNIYFFSPGTYKVEIYSADNELLGTKLLNVVKKKSKEFGKTLVK